MDFIDRVIHLPLPQMLTLCGFIVFVGILGVMAMVASRINSQLRKANASIDEIRLSLARRELEEMTASTPRSSGKPRLRP